MDSTRNKRSTSAGSSRTVRKKSGGRGASTSDRDPRAVGVEFFSSGAAGFLAVALDDGRVVITPLTWYPVLERATVAERKTWRISAGGRGVSWPELDVDLSVSGMLAGSPDVTKRARAMRPVRATYSRVLARLDRSGWLKAG